MLGPDFSLTVIQADTENMQFSCLTTGTYSAVIHWEIYLLTSYWISKEKKMISDIILPIVFVWGKRL